jgi:hypothetical protein
MRNFTLLTLVLLLSVSAFSQDQAKLQPVKKIYIGELRPAKSYSVKGSDVQEKLRLQLMKSKRFEVVDSREAADAVLTGVVWEPVGQAGGPTAPGPVFSSSLETNPLLWGKGTLHLVDAKSNQTIWTYEYQRGFDKNRAPGRIASIVIDKLTKDAQETSRTKTK